MSKPRITLIHPTSSPFSRNAAIALSEADLLHEIITTVAYNPKGMASRYLNLLPTSLRSRVAQELGRRTWIPPEGVPIRTYPWKEAMRVALMRTGLSRQFGVNFQDLVAWVYASLDRHVAKHHLQGLDAVYAYEDGAATTFQAAKSRGITCLYELPILFYRRSREIQAQEAEYFPELAPALQAVQEPAWKIQRKEQEVQLADHIFVPSSFVKQSLLNFGIEQEKISVIPYGAPVDYFRPQPKLDERFRALFVGRVGPRKGVHYLMQAWQNLQLPEAELVLVGANEFPVGWLDKYTNVCRYIPSVPHASLINYYTTASVLVFPSLVEGFGLVILEAMACGIPVITTSHTAGINLFTDGVEGFIIPIRDVEAIQEKLEWCYHHPQELKEMGRAARRRAEEFTWELYRQRLSLQVQKLLSNRCI